MTIEDVTKFVNEKISEKQGFEFHNDLTLDDMIYPDDFYYNLTSGGYINPEALLADSDQAELVNLAIRILMNFESDYTEFYETLESEDEE